jgi:hypothetical protein
MELTPARPRSPYLGSYKTFGSIGVAGVGAMLLIIVAIQFTGSTLAIDRLDLGVIAFGIAVIGLAYYKQRGALSQVEGKIDDSLVLRLCMTADAMACFGYLICIFAVGLAHHH